MVAPPPFLIIPGAISPRRLIREILRRIEISPDEFERLLKG